MKLNRTVTVTDRVTKGNLTLQVVKTEGEITSCIVRDKNEFYILGLSNSEDVNTLFELLKYYLER